MYRVRCGDCRRDGQGRVGVSAERFLGDERRKAQTIFILRLFQCLFQFQNGLEQKIGLKKLNEIMRLGGVARKIFESCSNFVTIAKEQNNGGCCGGKTTGRLAVSNCFLRKKKKIDIL